MQPMSLKEYIFGSLRDLKAELIFTVMARVLNRQPIESDAKDFELEREDHTNREFLCYRKERIGEIKLNYLPSEKVEANDVFQWQFTGINLTY
jgi:hypothetical protein